MTDPRIHERRVRVQRQRGHRRLGIVVGLLLAAGLSAGTFALLHTSLFGARTVVIAGAVHTERGQILLVTGLNREPPLIDVNTTTMARRLDRLPWVAAASVAVDWPSTVAVAVVERIPVATAHLAKGGYGLLDATGRVLSDKATRPRELPLVGVAGILGRPGSSIDASAGPLLAAAAALPVSLLPQVEAIVDTPGEGIVLRLEGGVTAIVGDDDALAQKFVSLATVLRRVHLDGVGTIDLSIPAAPVLTPPGQPLYRSGKG
jgi:cell division protein FtsQ